MKPNGISNRVDPSISRVRLEVVGHYWIRLTHAVLSYEKQKDAGLVDDVCFCVDLLLKKVKTHPFGINQSINS